MNIYKVLNEIMLYIEENLDKKIDYEVLSRKMGVDEYTMRRVFSLLTNISLTEYVRKRRLSNAGYDLYEGNLRVIDVAFKYGYENATSFSRAFMAFHGIKPSQVNKSSKLKNFSCIRFDEEKNFARDIEYEIISLDEMVLYGTGIEVNNENIEDEAPKFFEEMDDKYSSQYGNISYAFITYTNECREECNGYYILYDKEISGFQRFVIPRSKWLLFKVDSDRAEDIRKVSQQFYIDFLPSCKFKFSDLPEIEYYHDGVVDFLVPIK